MLTLLTLFFTSFVVAFSGAMMPGPLMTATISESAMRGPWVGPKMIAGHALLEILLLITLFFGLEPVFKKRMVFCHRFPGRRGNHDLDGHRDVSFYS